MFEVEKHTRMGQKHVFGDVFKVDNVRLVSKDIPGFIKLIIFWFCIRMGGKKVKIDFEML